MMFYSQGVVGALFWCLRCLLYKH